MNKPLVDFTLGDALFPFNEVAAYALERSQENLHQYICNNPNYPTMSQPLLDTLDAITPYLSAKGFIDRDQTERIAYRSIVTGGGASEGFEYILRLLTLDISEHNSANEDRKIKPVIIMPTPTYGFFFNMIKQWGITIAPVKRDIKNGGALDLNSLKKALNKIDKKGYRVIAFFDSNPNNPTGLVRDETETRAIADIINHTNKAYAKRDKDEDRKWDGPAARIRIIDDLVYTGTEYEGVTPAYSFIQIPECRDNTFLLLGLSKIGLAGLRSGFLMSHNEDDMNALRVIQQNGSYFPSRPAMHALEGFFRMDEPFKSQREKHMQSLANTHERGAHLMKAIVNGLDSMSELSPAQKQSLISHVAQLQNTPEKAAETFLNNPMKNAKILTTPQAGFFHLMDLSAIKDRTYYLCNTPQKKEYTKVEGEFVVKHYADNENVYILSGKWMGYGNGDEMIFRMTYALPERVIIDGLERLRVFLDSFEKPENK